MTHHFAVALNNPAGWLLSQSGYASYAKSEDSFAIFQGTIFRSHSGKNVSQQAHREIALYLLKEAIRTGESFFPQVEGNFVCVIGTPESLIAFKSEYSPFQLYYSSEQLSNRLLYALPNCRCQPNVEFVARHLCLSSPLFANSEMTPVDGVSRLLPAHVIKWHKDSLAPTIIDLRSEKRSTSFDRRQESNKVANDVRDIFDSVISDNLNFYKNRPIACEVSGGLDSSFVTTMVGSKAVVSTAYMYSFPKNPSHKRTEEYARKIAACVDVDLKIIGPDNLEFSGLDQVGPYQDEPFDFFWQSHLFGPASKNIVPENAILFNGLGSDEIFNRNNRFIHFLLKKKHWTLYLSTIKNFSRELDRSLLNIAYQSLVSLLPSKFRGSIAKGTPNVVSELLRVDELFPDTLLGQEQNTWISQQLKSLIGSSEFACDERLFARHIEDGGLHADFSYVAVPQLYLGSYLETKNIDYISPFTDRRLIQYVDQNVSQHLIHQWGTPTKSLLREAQKGIVPNEVRTRPNGEFHFDGFLHKVLNCNHAFLLDEIQSSWLVKDNLIDFDQVMSNFEKLFFGMGYQSRSTQKVLTLVGYLTWWRNFQAHAKQIEHTTSIAAATNES